MTAPYDSDFASGPRNKPGRSFSILNVLLGLGIVGVLIGLMLPATRSARPAARRTQCMNNLKEIALGLRNYESEQGCLPPAYTVDSTGKPLHSWRTLILPYIEQSSLYATIDLSKPWNDPANAKACAVDVLTYHCPEPDLPSGYTSYLAIVAPGGCFLPGRPRLSSEITDDRKATLMVIDAPTDRAVHWMSPVDADAALVMEISSRSKLNHAGIVTAAFADGGARTFNPTLPAAVRRALISIAGGDDEALRASY